MSASSNLCMNGNMHTNKNADISYLNGNINGRITTGNDIEKRVKHVYSDQKIMETYFTENCDLHEEEYVYSDMNIHINNPIFCYNNITLDGNVSLNSNLGSLMNINITGEVKNANTAVVYSKYGDITIENDSTANINGLIYVPLGTLTINSPNINLNGVIIADKIVINGSSININYKDDIAQFIGNTSEVYDFSGLEYLPEEWLGDTDEDELFDIYEKVIDTDPFDSDTDDDGLPDGYEVITLNTDPLEIDTDENGISDADEDFDSDNLSNLGEYNHGTEPFNPDTDEDGFMDGDEVYTYGTEPLNPDTDNDGLLDGEESYDGSIYAKYGIYFDPLNPDTNGNGILDGEEVFGQSKKQEVSTHDEAITEIKVDMDTNGNLDRNLTVESMYNVDAMSTNVYALIGEPFNFTSATDFKSATITFKIDKSKLGDTKFDNLLILWYDEENQIFKEMETIHDEANSTVSTTTTHFSQYMIVDSEKWFDNWEESFVQLRKMWSGNTSYYKALNTILIVDCSWKMANVDPISYSIEVGYNGVTKENEGDIRREVPSDIDYYMEKYGRHKCNRAYICENIINNLSSGDRAMIMNYSNGIENNTGWSSNWDYLMNGGTSKSCGIQRVNNNGGTLYLSDAVSAALSYVTHDVENTYRIVIITSGSVNYGSSLSAFDYSNVSLNIVSLGGGSISSGIESIAQSTGGDVYYGYPSSSLTGASGSSVTIPPQFIGEDSDGDGIPDLVELYGLMPNGKPIGTSPYLADTDGDGIPDNEEIHFSLDNLTHNINKNEYDGAVVAWSDPKSQTVPNPFGQIIYKGEVYKIDVPAIRSRQSQCWYEPAYEVVETFRPKSKTEFDLLGYIYGKELGVTDDPDHDATGKIDLYYIADKKGYLKGEFKTKNIRQLTCGLASIAGDIEDLIVGPYTRKSVSFTFYKTEKNDARKVIITAASTDAENAYTPYANDLPTSAFINNSGNIPAQLSISNSAEKLYSELTGKSINTSCYYDIMITVDKRHANNGNFAQLWINNDGNVMAAPLLYSNDKVEIGKRSGWFPLFDYTPLIELKLSDNINLEQDFVDMFNKIYSQN